METAEVPSHLLELRRAEHGEHKVSEATVSSAVVPEVMGPRVSVFENANYITDNPQYWKEVLASWKYVICSCIFTISSYSVQVYLVLK